MGFFPLPHRPRSFHGPHMTCVQSAETYESRLRSRATHIRFDFLMEKSITFGHLRFLVFFSFGQVTLVALASLGLTFLTCYLFMQLFLRFQYKLAILFVLLGRRQLRFDNMNRVYLLGLHLLLLLIGGFGWILLLFIET